MPTILQEYTDILFEFQCCMATKAQELNSLDEIGNDCYSEKFLELTEITLIFETLLCQNIEELECLDKDDIVTLLNFLKTKCKNCCTDIRKFKKLL